MLTYREKERAYHTYSYGILFYLFSVTNSEQKNLNNLGKNIIAFCVRLQV